MLVLDFDKNSDALKRPISIWLPFFSLSFQIRDTIDRKLNFQIALRFKSV